VKEREVFCGGAYAGKATALVRGVAAESGKGGVVGRLMKGGR